MKLFPDGDGIGAGAGVGGNTEGTATGSQNTDATGQPVAGGADPRQQYFGERDALWNSWMSEKGNPGSLNALRRFAEAHGMTLAEAKQEVKEQAAAGGAAKPTEDPEIAEMRKWYKEQKASRESEQFDRDLAAEVTQAVGSHPLVKDQDIGPFVRDYVAGMRLLRPDIPQAQVYKMAIQALEPALAKYSARVGGQKIKAAAVLPLRGGGSAGGSRAPKFDPKKVSFAQMAEKTAVELDGE